MPAINRPIFSNPAWPIRGQLVGRFAAETRREWGWRSARCSSRPVSRSQQSMATRLRN